MRLMHALNGGRIRIWLLHHGQDAKNAAYLTVILSAFLLVSHSDYRDAIELERAAREVAVEELRQERAARDLPRTTFVIEARTPEEANRRLAEIAGDLDGWRAANRGRK